MASLELMPWDTKHFGIAVGRLSIGANDTVDKLRTSLRDSAFNMVVARVGIENVAGSSILEAAGFILRDVRVHLGLKLTDFHPAKPKQVAMIVGYDERHRESLRRISSRSFWSDHYHADPGIDKHKVDQMYSLWIDKCVREGCVIRVALEGRRVVGFLAGRDVDDGFYIELVAVDKGLRGKGVAGDLLGNMLSALKDERRTATIGVQLANVAALRLYERLGFKVESAELTFHWWRPEDGERSLPNKRLPTTR
jgi:ribosomal protein S18 acetylase RimI-like enzyme